MVLLGCAHLTQTIGHRVQNAVKIGDLVSNERLGDFRVPFEESLLNPLHKSHRIILGSLGSSFHL